MKDQNKTAEDEQSPEERAGGYRVLLPSFEGPLDLLLHLIKKHELNILDIPIGFIAKKYVEYLRTMEMLSIDIAAEYLVMAATLAHIKSRSLLPPDPSQAEDDDILAEEEDPRAELIRRLLEYQKYKLAAEELGGRSVLGRDTFTRGAPNEAELGQAPLAQLSLFKLVDAFEGVLQRAKLVEDHHIDFERISVTERIGQISDQLRLQGPMRFDQLFEEDVSRADMIVTFLAILEMTKLRMTNIRQDGPLETIYVELSVVEDLEDRSDLEWPARDSGTQEGDDGDDALRRPSDPDPDEFSAEGPEEAEELGAGEGEDMLLEVDEALAFEAAPDSDSDEDSVDETSASDAAVAKVFTAEVDVPEQSDQQGGPTEKESDETEESLTERAAAAELEGQALGFSEARPEFETTT
ncbi:MAG: hypothetical protein RJA70_1598, partial [Pseudomonadota bacterium]